MRVWWIIALSLVVVGGCDCGGAEPPGGDMPGVGDMELDRAQMDAGLEMDIGVRGDAADDGGGVLEADAGASRYVLVGEEIELDGGASVGAVRYQWDFGNGEGWEQAREQAQAMVRYDQAGRYKAVLTVWDARGQRRSDTVTLSVTHPPEFAPRESRSMVFAADSAGAAAGQLAVVVEDSGELVRYRWDGAQATFVSRLEVCGEGGARRLAWLGDDRWGVSCPGEDRVRLVQGDQILGEHVFDWGARPFAVVAPSPSQLLVGLQGSGQLAVLDVEQGGFALQRTQEGVEDLRALAMLPDGRVVMSRWRSPDAGGQLGVLDWEQAGASLERWVLPVDPQKPSDTEVGGLPTYLESLLVSPTGRALAVSGLQANVFWGRQLAGEDFRHDTIMRAVVSVVDLPGGASEPSDRLQFDSRGFAYGGVWSPRGDYLYVSMRGSQVIERVDMLGGGQASGTIFAVGYAPEALALSGDGRHLFVEATLARRVGVYELGEGLLPLEPVQSLELVGEEPLDAEILLGKQLFNDSADMRLAQEGYVACAHCHLEGATDNLVWDFTDRGEGMRNTISMLGRAGEGDGPIHWSGNFDEIQDFEHDIRGPFGGRGFLTAAQWMEAGSTLGVAKAGMSAELDALAAYARSLKGHWRSPHRAADGSLSVSAERGRVLFESAQLGCTGCHAGERMTDSQFLMTGQPLLHDVGTLSMRSGQRLGEGPLEGVDTPSLHGLWSTAPYLHDGSAGSVREVLIDRNRGDVHGVTSGLSDAEVADLVAYLLSLEG